MDDKSKQKVEGLMEQFPFIGEHYEEFLRTYPRARASKSDGQVSVKVQRADTSFMYRKPDNALGKTSRGEHWILSKDGRATRHEYGIFVDKNEKAIPFHNGTRTSERIGRYIESHRVDGERVKYILWVRMTDWYATSKTDDENEPLSHLFTEMEYEAHLPPKSMTLNELVKSIDLLHNVELTSRMLMDGILDRSTHDLYLTVNERLGAIAKRFEREVFNLDMAKIIDASKSRGMSCVIGGVTVMSFVMAGRCMITLEAPNREEPNYIDSFTLICSEPPDEPNMGYQGIAATADRAEELVSLVSQAWAKLSSEERKQLHVKDQEVKILGM
jgi:hypothetical protein